MSEILQDNIITLSNADVFKDALKEWVFLYEEYSPTYRMCPCNRGIKHIAYYYNPSTKNFVMLGTGCRKHFESALNYKNTILSHLTGKPDEMEVEDVGTFGVEYNEDVMEQLTTYFQKQYDTIPNEKLEELYEKIVVLYVNYKMYFMRDLYVKTKIRYETYKSELLKAEVLQRQVREQDVKRSTKKAFSSLMEDITNELQQRELEDEDDEPRVLRREIPNHKRKKETSSEEEEEEVSSKCDRCGAKFPCYNGEDETFVVYEKVKRYGKIVNYCVCENCEKMIDQFIKRGYSKCYEY